MGFSKNILITGATGNLGAQLLKFILSENKNFNIFLLIRAENKILAKKRVDDLLNLFLKKRNKDFLKSNIVALVGDVAKNKFGLSNKEYILLSQKIDVVYHSAALTRFHDPISQLRLANVVGTQRVLDFVSQGKKSVELHYLSTAFVAGNFEGKFGEDNFDVGQDFNNPYERSKFEAERRVRNFSKSWKKVRIFRPSIIVGDYQTGTISDFQMFYKPLYLLSKEVFREIPINKSTLLNLIPVDVAARAIYVLANDSVYDNNLVYHIVSPNAFNIIKIIELASKYFNFNKPKLFKKTIFKDTALGRLYKEPVRPFLNYFTFKAQFECQKTIDRLARLGFCFPNVDENFLRRIFSYTVKRKYIRINH